MTLPSYQILTLSPYTGAVTGFFDATVVEQVQYSRVLNDVGIVAFTVPGTDENFNLFALDTFIEVYRTHPVSGSLVREETYLARMRQRFREGDLEKIVVGGVSLNHLLQRRVIDPEDDPLEAGGYSTKAGPADDVIASYIAEQAGNLASAERAFPGLTVASTLGVGGPVGQRFRYEILLEKMRELAKSGNVAFRIERTSGVSMQAVVGLPGVDRTRIANYPGQPFVGLDPQRGNLTNPSLTQDRREEKNFLYALGKGQGATRSVLKIAGSGLNDSPYNRMEFSEDVRTDSDNALDQLNAGLTRLNTVMYRATFDYSPTGDEPGNIYREDWDLGDTVTVLWGGVEINIRITEVEINLSAEGERLNIGVEEVYV